MGAASASLLAQSRAVETRRYGAEAGFHRIKGYRGYPDLGLDGWTPDLFNKDLVAARNGR